MIHVDIDDALAPPILTLISVILGYLWGRTVRRGKPLSSIQKTMLFYFGLLMLGLTYAIILQVQLAILFHWKNAWVAVMVAWGALLATIAWAKHRGTRSLAPPKDAA